jgi:hypothetical protein
MLECAASACGPCVVVCSGVPAGGGGEVLRATGGSNGSVSFNKLALDGSSPLFVLAQSGRHVGRGWAGLTGPGGPGIEDTTFRSTPSTAFVCRTKGHHVAMLAGDIL